MHPDHNNTHLNHCPVEDNSSLKKPQNSNPEENSGIFVVVVVVLIYITKIVEMLKTIEETTMWQPLT